MSKDTFDTFTVFCKTQKVTSLLNEYQLVLLLRLVTEVIFRSNQITMSLQDLVEPLISFIKDTQTTPAVRTAAIDCIKTIGYRCPREWLHTLIP